MPKSFSTYVFVVLSAAYFLIAGAGYNIIQYCCDSCAHSGIEEVAHVSCDALHKHLHATSTQHEHDDDMACSNVSHHANGCHLLRVKVDTPSIQTSTQNPGNSVQDMDLPHIVTDFITASLQSAQLREIIPPPNLLLHAAGRRILALHAVLLI